MPATKTASWAELDSDNEEEETSHERGSNYATSGTEDSESSHKKRGSIANHAMLARSVLLRRRGTAHAKVAMGCHVGFF
jgi:hypothetical protein